jgi:acyl-CoA thioester hydrolase
VESSLNEKTYHYEVRVGYADTDQMGFAHHSRYLVYMESARTELLRSIGDSYRAMEQRGFLLPVLESKLCYHKPARYDDILNVKVNLAELGRLRLRFDYQVLCPERDELLVSSYTLHAFMNKEGRPVRASQEELDRLSQLLSG